MKNKQIIVFLILFLFGINKVNAEWCSQDDFNRVKEEVDKITIEFDLVDNEENKGIYNITIRGLSDDIYMVDEENDIVIASDIAENGMVVLKNFLGRNLKFNVYYKTCDSKLIKTINVDIPKYNFYADDVLCDGISGDELSVCDEWYQEEITYDEFKQIIENYNQKQEKENNKVNIFLKNIKDFFVKNYIYFLISVVIVGAVIAVVYIKKKKSSLD